MFFVLKEEYDKLVRKLRCLFCDVRAINEILEQNGLTTSTTTTTTTTTTTSTTTTSTSTTSTTTTP